MNKETFSFIVYMIHEAADAWNLRPGDAYRLLRESGCIDDYLDSHYEVLHTMGSKHVVDEMKEFVEKRGYAVTI